MSFFTCCIHSQFQYDFTYKRYLGTSFTAIRKRHKQKTLYKEKNLDPSLNIFLGKVAKIANKYSIYLINIPSNSKFHSVHVVYLLSLYDLHSFRRPKDRRAGIIHCYRFTTEQLTVSGYSCVEHIYRVIKILFSKHIIVTLLN